MKIIDSSIKQIRQGDCLLTRVASIPSGAKKVDPKDGKFIAAHSETGHDHVIEAKPGVELFDTENPLISYLRVIEQTETTLEHLRSFDTHESYLLKGGCYEIRRQRQKTPEGWARVQD
jgi:hypothetical protein